MYRLAPFLVAAWLILSTVATAQFKNVFSFSEDVAANSGMQLYLDFDPLTGAAPTLPPPQGPTDADLFVVVVGLPPMIGDLNSSGFAYTVAERINTAFRSNEWFDPSLYRAKVREGVRPEDPAHDASIEIRSPVDLYEVYTSGSSGSPPGSPLGGGGNSFNPSIFLRTDEIRNAFPGAPGAQMIVNGRDPAGNDFHLIEQEIPGTLRFDFAGLPFQPIAFFTSQYNPGFLNLAPVVNGSIDIGPGIAIIFDGVGGASPLDPFRRTDATGNYTVTATIAPATPPGGALAFQAIIQDPTAPSIVPYSMTQAADVQFATGRTVDLALGNDGTAMVQLGAGKSFDFYGVSYSQLFVNSNGFLTFGAPSSLSATFLIDPVSALQAEPSLFVHMADYDPSTSIVQYREFGAEARVTWGEQGAPVSHPGLIDQAVFSTTMFLTVPAGTTPPAQSEHINSTVMSTAQNPGSIFFDWLTLDDFSTNPAFSYDALVGISPGGVLNPAQVPSLDLGETQAPAMPAAFSPIVELSNIQNMAVTQLGAASGGQQRYNNGAAYAGSSLGFYPIDVSGSPGYFSVPDQNRPDDVQDTNLQSLSVSASVGNTIPFELYGKFKFFDRRATMTTLFGTVDLVHPLSGTVIPLTTVQIYSDTPPPNPPTPGNTPIAPLLAGTGMRDFEVLAVEVPAGALNNPTFPVGSTFDIVVTFPTGQIFTIPGIPLVP